MIESQDSFALLCFAFAFAFASALRCVALLSNKSRLECFGCCRCLLSFASGSGSIAIPYYCSQLRQTLAGAVQDQGTLYSHRHAETNEMPSTKYRSNRTAYYKPAVIVIVTPIASAIKRLLWQRLMACTISCTNCRWLIESRGADAS